MFREANFGLNLRSNYLKFHNASFTLRLMETTTAKQEIVRVALQKEFVERCRKNPAYSLRAFAKFLNVDQSFLSKVLNGKRPITVELASVLAPKLGIKQSELKYVFTSATRAMPAFTPLAEDELDLLSSWQHFAILELAKTKKSSADATVVAKRLGIHVEEARSSLERLQRMGFITVKNKKIILLKRNNSWTSSEKTTAARKQLQRELLENSLNIIDHVPFEKRENNSLIVAIDKSRIAEFKNKLTQIQDELAAFLQPTEAGLDEVYQLTIAFGPLTQNNKD